MTFEEELRHIINKHSMENGSDTPDFILADYLLGCLENFGQVAKRRDQWYSRDQTPPHNPDPPPMSGPSAQDVLKDITYMGDRILGALKVVADLIKIPDSQAKKP